MTLVESSPEDASVITYDNLIDSSSFDSSSLPSTSQQLGTVLLIGQWPAVSAQAETVSVGSTTIMRCEPRVRACQIALSSHDPQWLVLGTGPDDEQRNALIRACRLTASAVSVAVLDVPNDLLAAERWLRRGSRAYLSVDSPVDRVLKILIFCQQSGTAVVDQCFQDRASHEQRHPLAALTKREAEVLGLVRLGRRNKEIARELQVSDSTVDFHIRNLLVKLGARNRVDAVRRALALGM